MDRILLILLTLIAIACATPTSQPNDVCKPWLDGYAIKCTNLGADGRSFPEAIGHMSAEYLSRIIYVDIRAHHYVYFGRSPFALFPNLKALQIWKTTSGDDDQNVVVTMPADAFRTTPLLEIMSLGNLVLPESTVQAMASLKDQVERLNIANLNPETRVLSELAKFTKLRSLEAQVMCASRAFPTVVFENSAPTLEEITLDGCSLPKITKNLFSSMPNLSKLQWVGSNITEIEPESFDANPKLASINLSENKIRCLPIGLFDKLRNLTAVSFSGNEMIVSGLSRGNFSQGAMSFTSFTYQICMP